MRQIVLDTETTGLEPEQGHRIVELAAIEIRHRRVTSEHIHFYLNPERDSDPEALKVHGLEREFLAGQPRFAEVAQRLVDFVAGAEVIIHNAAFDTKFLNAELERIGQPPFNQLCAKVTDSLALARELFPGKRNNLDALCERFGISNAHRTLHGALLDSELLGEVWLALTRGQDSFLDQVHTDEVSTAELASRKSSFDASKLLVIEPDTAELQAHEAYLDELDRAAGGTCLWRALTQPNAAGDGS